MLFLLEEKCVEVLASAVETGGEGLVLSFEKVQIAMLCLRPHLLQEYFNLQDTAECPFSKHKKHKRFNLGVSFLAIDSQVFKNLLKVWLFLLQNTHLFLPKFLPRENKAEDEKLNFSSFSLQSLKHAPIANERSLASILYAIE